MAGLDGIRVDLARLFFPQDHATPAAQNDAGLFAADLVDDAPAEAWTPTATPAAEHVGRHDVGRAPTTSAWKLSPLQPGQFELRTRAYAPFETFGGGFEGDARGPTARLDVTSRITNKTVVDTRQWNDLGGVSIVSNEAYSDMSRWTSDSLGIDDYGRATPRATLESRDWGEYNELRTHIAGSNPLLPAPDIDVDTRMTISRQGNVLSITGDVRGDAFPNEEMLLTDSKGQTILLQHFETGSGALGGPLTKLWGHGDANMGHVAVQVILDEDGNFAAVRDPRTGKTYSVEAWNRDVMGAER